MWKIKKIVKKGDYLYAIVRNHPKRTKNDYVLLHRVVVENHIGRLLNPDEVVHHKDGNKKNNEIQNLEVINASEHTRLHGLQKGRVYVDIKCPWCKIVFTREKRQTHLAKKGQYTTCSAPCRGKFSRSIQLRGITTSVNAAISGNILRVYTKYSSDNPEVTA